MEPKFISRRDHQVKTVYHSVDHAIFAFEIRDLTDPAISSYTALQLLDSGEGQATCLLCRKTYAAEELMRFQIGAGDSPFNVRNIPWGIRDRLFGSNRLKPGIFSGKGFKCPGGHRLISMITWMA
jgi:hypothetical protein